MTKVIVKTYHLVDEHKQKVVRIFMVACATLLVFYGWNIYLTVVRTAALKKIYAETRQVEGSIRVLDAKYIALSSRITPEMAVNYGLKEIPVSAFINRTTTLGLR